MIRRVEPELLDALPAQDPRAKASRRDLRRLNRWMGNAGIMARVLNSVSPRVGPKQVVEAGAGDGHFLWSVARRLPREWRGSHAVLIDRQNVVATDTRQSFARMGWQLETVHADVFHWLQAPRNGSCDFILTNLFLHHLDGDGLSGFLRAIAERTRAFIALEPRRSRWALLCGRLVGLIGCNEITRNDAPASVRAGFNRQELSSLWPRHYDWSLLECRAGPFGHLFVAHRQHAFNA